MYALREFQSRALESLRELIRRGKRRNVLVSPTGSGKTVMAAHMVLSAVGKGSRCLFLAHRKELITQCSEKLDGLGVDHGVIMASHPRWRPHAPVQVASVPTLVRRLWTEKLTDMGFDLIFCDECHHARAKSYDQVFKKYSNAPVIGLTATPKRGDGKGLAELFDGLVVAATVQELMDMTYLVPAVGFSYEIPDLTGVRKLGGDYREDQLATAMSQIVLGGNVVEKWLECARGRRTVVFTVNVAHSQLVAEHFRAAGVPAEHLDGSTPGAERDALLRRLADGTTQVVSNCAVLTEGWDCPAVECIILLRPTASETLGIQMIGRGLRPYPGKTVLRIHDHAGVVLAHGLPETPRDYSLEQDKPPGEAPLTRCRECYALFPAGCTTCPNCGAVLERPEGKGREIVYVEGRCIDLDELRAKRAAEGLERKLTPGQLQMVASATMEDKAREFLRLQKVQQAKGFKPGFISHQYREVFGCWPKLSDKVLSAVTPGERPFISLPPRRRE